MCTCRSEGFAFPGFPAVHDGFHDRLVHFRAGDFVEEFHLDTIMMEMTVIAVFFPGKCHCFLLRYPF